MRRRHFGYFDDPWYVRLLKWLFAETDVREQFSESTDAQGKPFRLIGRRELLDCELSRERLRDVLEGRQAVVSATLEATRGDFPRVADAVRDFFVAEGVCPACAYPIHVRSSEGSSSWVLCNECGRSWRGESWG